MAAPAGQPLERDALSETLAPDDGEIGVEEPALDGHALPDHLRHEGVNFLAPRTHLGADVVKDQNGGIAGRRLECKLRTHAGTESEAKALFDVQPVARFIRVDAAADDRGD